MAVGMVPPEIFDRTIEDLTLHFTHGDCLALYTDGVTESINNTGEEYSSNACQTAMCSSWQIRGGDPQQLPE